MRCKFTTNPLFLKNKLSTIHISKKSKKFLADSMLFLYLCTNTHKITRYPPKFNPRLARNAFQGYFFVLKDISADKATTSGSGEHGGQQRAEFPIGQASRGKCPLLNVRQSKSDRAPGGLPRCSARLFFCTVDGGKSHYASPVDTEELRRVKFFLTAS